MDKEYIGNIYMITSINDKLLTFLQKYDVVDDDNLCACAYVLAKNDAKLIKINDNCYIDYDSIKSTEDAKNIARLLENGAKSNILMKSIVYFPYIGQLFVKDIKVVKSKKLKYTQK